VQCIDALLAMFDRGPIRTLLPAPKCQPYILTLAGEVASYSMSIVSQQIMGLTTQYAQPRVSNAPPHLLADLPGSRRLSTKMAWPRKDCMKIAQTGMSTFEERTFVFHSSFCSHKRTANSTLVLKPGYSISGLSLYWLSSPPNNFDNVLLRENYQHIIACFFLMT
jgi:hypothetical protein